ncbi:hypothetical protein PC128_g21836 [Phytophthora cactorum]|nr:hypothetical protein PC128_g21836 [Phytophthora cactorum]
MIFISPVDLSSYYSPPRDPRPHVRPSQHQLDQDPDQGGNKATYSCSSCDQAASWKPVSANPGPPTKRGRRKDPVWDDVIVAQD